MTSKVRQLRAVVGSTARLSRRHEPCELGPLSLEAAGTTGSPAPIHHTFTRLATGTRMKPSVVVAHETGSAYARSINSTLY
jgi:hypothetical protein